MGLSVWRETSKKLTLYRVCYTPIETLIYMLANSKPLSLFKEGFRNCISVASLVRCLNVLLFVASRKDTKKELWFN